MEEPEHQYCIGQVGMASLPTRVLPDRHVPSAQFVHLCVWLGRWREGVCLEKAEKRKRDRKTTEGRERPMHGPAVRVVQGQSMFDVLSALGESA